MNSQTKINVEIETQARLLCTRIDSEIAKPAVVLVTSAESGDGSSFTAETLANAFARFGRRTALFDATRDGRAGRTSALPSSSDYKTDSPTVVAMRPFERFASRDALGEFVRSLRTIYDVTIIDAPPVMESTGAMTLGDLADATVVALRFGRRPGQGDEVTAQMLHACKSQFLGVVTTDPDVVERNARDRREERSAGEVEIALTSDALCPTSGVNRVRREASITVTGFIVFSFVCAALLVAVS